ncbi:MAG: Uma2 family endonuclease [Syntrophobacteraceae bacterium]|nr:Uma2 family endonuclease [Syntrophobacteraceae bacterium]
MAESAKKNATYEDLFTIPENTTGEIINGELFVTPRPSRKHTYSTSVLNSRIGPPYQFAEGGGPGSWIIIVAPEIKLGENILVPDLAGWKKEGFPFEEDTNWISAAPDWVCEILSPGTASLDKSWKMPVYALHGVACAWIIDPMAMRTLDVYGLAQGGGWRLLASYGENDLVRANPFEEIEIKLSDLWLENRGAQTQQP